MTKKSVPRVGHRRKLTSNAQSSGRTVRKGDYGAVLVIGGRHKGRVGYYDDDDGVQSVVYFGVPFKTRPAMIRRTLLVKVDWKHLPLELWKRKFPEIATQVGVR